VNTAHEFKRYCLTRFDEQTNRVEIEISIHSNRVGTTLSRGGSCTGRSCRSCRRRFRAHCGRLGRGAVCDGVCEVVAVDVVFIDVDVGEGGSFEDAVSADEPLPTHPDSPAPAQSVAIA
jgi:hypothetical protein